ncbi:MAG: TIGR02391 family protein [Planctomycetes bacterium RBG_13_60_9]|nr:MAG: TIGR02391 family protein [Planctomycetes bacterium RBG_13_60_9]
MDRSLQHFEAIARKAHKFTETDPRELAVQHPFEKRDVHPDLPMSVRQLFDDGHYAQATFEAFKFLDKLVQNLARLKESGFKCMMQAFAETSPLIALTPNQTTTEKDEQKGFQFIFAGSMSAIRNPRGHEFGLKDSPDTCLDHLALVSLLLRRLEQAGHKTSM